MTKHAELLPGTLDVLILKAVSLGDVHGYGVLLRIEQISGGALEVQQGALYPALYRLEHQGLIASEWGKSKNNRRAKFYKLTRSGRHRLGEEKESWNRLAEAMAMVFAETLVLAVIAAGVGLASFDWLLGHVPFQALAGETTLPYWFSLGVTPRAVAWAWAW